MNIEKDTPCFAFTAELLGVLTETIGEELVRDIESSLCRSTAKEDPHAKT